MMPEEHCHLKCCQEKLPDSELEQLMFDFAHNY